MIYPHNYKRTWYIYIYLVIYTYIYREHDGDNLDNLGW
jgi:hypothetical protein